MSRIDNVITWVERLSRYSPLSSISMELVKFDTQAMDNPDISGAEYQQGALAGYELKEYLLETHGHKCAYCGATDVPLEVEHIIPKSRGGSNRAANLTIACVNCNREKGSKTAEEYGFPKIQKQCKAPMKDAAVVNASRWALYERLQGFGLPVETGSGGRTKFNRSVQGYPKEHWVDAACVGSSGANVLIDSTQPVLEIKAMGRGKRQMQQTDKYGFPKGKPRGAKRVFGFQTGDLVRAVIPNGKYAGIHIGRVTVRASGSFMVGPVSSASHKYFTLLQRSDGYGYKMKDISAHIGY